MWIVRFALRLANLLLVAVQGDIQAGGDLGAGAVSRGDPELAEGMYSPPARLGARKQIQPSAGVVRGAEIDVQPPEGTVVDEEVVEGRIELEVPDSYQFDLEKIGIGAQFSAPSATGWGETNGASPTPSGGCNDRSLDCASLKG